MRLTEIYQPIMGDIARVEEEIRRQVHSIGDERTFRGELYDYIRQVVGHMFASPGKLLRPALALFSSRLLVSRTGPLEARFISFAAAVEFFHSASLAHDDIIDGEQIRRNQPTLNRRYGNHIAVLVGDILYSRFFSLLTRMHVESPVRRMEIYDLFCKVTERMCIAEICEQRLLETAGFADAEDYLKILEYKTADLMAATCEGAAILCGAAGERRKALADFGRSFGMAFQLYDDSRDGDAIIRAETIGEKAQSAPAGKQRGSGMDLRARALEYVSRAEDALAALPPSDTRSLLNALCRYVSQSESQ